MKRTLLILFLVLSRTAASAQTAYTLINEVDLKNALVSPHRNVLKMYDVAVDERRGRAYTAGSQTEFAAMIDIAARQEIGSVQLPFQSQLHTLACNPANGYLLAYTSSNKTLYAVDPATSRHTGTHAFTAPRTGMAFYTPANQIFAGDGNLIKILDGDNLALLASFSAEMSAGGVHIDTLGQKLYAVSRNLIGGNAVVKIFSVLPPYALQRTIIVPATETLGELIADLPNDRLFLHGRRQIKTVQLSTGAVLATASTSAETSAKVYSVLQQKIFMTDEDGYAGQGMHGSWGKLYAYHPASGRIDSTKMGDKPARLAIDNNRHVLVMPSMHAGLVELLDLSANTIDTVDVGESADEFALSPAGNTLYIVKRLGGSQVIRYDIGARQFAQMRAGNWPCVAKVDSSLGKLFVLNVYESSVSVFDCASNRLLETIRLSLPEGRTDAIPVMHLDPSLHRLYIGFPEFAKIVVVSTESLAEEGAISIPGFRFDADLHAAIGVIQLITLPQHHKLLALQKRERKLKVFDLNSLALLDSVDMQPLWPTSSSFESNLWEYDAVSGKLFLGNRLLDPVTYQTVATLAGAERILGYKRDRSALYGISARRGEVTVHEHDPVTYAERSSQLLFQQAGEATPVFYYDAARHDLFIAEFNYAVLRHYDLDGAVTGVRQESETALQNFRLHQNYPNPFNPSTVISFQLPVNSHVTLKVFDVNGREVATLVEGDFAAGAHAVRFTASGLPSGVYFYQITAGKFSQTRKAFLLK